MGHWRVIPNREESERQLPMPYSALGFLGGFHLGIFIFFVEVPPSL